MGLLDNRWGKTLSCIENSALTAPECNPTTIMEEFQKRTAMDDINGIPIEVECNKPLRLVCPSDPCSSSNIKSPVKCRAPGPTSALKWDAETIWHVFIGHESLSHDSHGMHGNCQGGFPRAIHYPGPKQCAARILMGRTERTQNHQWLQANRTRATVAVKAWCGRRGTRLESASSRCEDLCRRLCARSP